MASLNLLDYCILILIGISTLISLWRGFIREVLSFIIWVLAFVIAIVFSHPASQYLSWMSDKPSVTVTVSFIVLFLLTLIVGALISFLIAKLIDITGLSGTNRFLGAIFGFLRGILVITIIVFCLQWSNIQNQSIWKQSTLISFFTTLSSQLKTMIPTDILKAVDTDHLKKQKKNVSTRLKEKVNALEKKVKKTP